MLLLLLLLSWKDFAFLSFHNQTDVLKQLAGDPSIPEKGWLLSWLLVCIQGLSVPMPKSSSRIHREVSAVLCAKGQVSVLGGKGPPRASALESEREGEGLPIGQRKQNT